MLTEPKCCDVGFEHTHDSVSEGDNMSDAANALADVIDALKPLTSEARTRVSVCSCCVLLHGCREACRRCLRCWAEEYLMRTPAANCAVCNQQVTALGSLFVVQIHEKGKECITCGHAQAKIVERYLCSSACLEAFARSDPS